MSSNFFAKSKEICSKPSSPRPLYHKTRPNVKEGEPRPGILGQLRPNKALGADFRPWPAGKPLSRILPDIFLGHRQRSRGPRVLAACSACDWQGICAL